MSLRVIHFIEAGGAGVWSATHNWILSTPELEHIVLVRPRGLEFEYFSDLDRNCKVFIWRGNLISGYRNLRSLVDQHQPDLIHFHSTWSGLLRIMNWKLPVIYSPHCFAFQNSNLGSALKFVYYLVEKLLSFKTTGFVLVSDNEQDIALKLNNRKKTIVLSHYSPEWSPKDPVKKIVGIGRITEQKNPHLFIQIAKLLRSEDETIVFYWIGDGDNRLRVELESSGVHVTGWIKKAELKELTGDAACLLHTALWEGMPLVFSELLAGGIPIVALERDYLKNDQRILTFRTPSEAAFILKNLITHPTRIPKSITDLEIEGNKLFQFYSNAAVSI